MVELGLNSFFFVCFCVLCVFKFEFEFGFGFVCVLIVFNSVFSFFYLIKIDKLFLKKLDVDVAFFIIFYFF